MAETAQAGDRPIGDLLEWAEGLPEELLKHANPTVVELLNVVGRDACFALLRHWGGLSLYVPQADAALQGVVNEAIRREFDGRNTTYLVRKYGCTRRHVLNLVSDQNLNGGSGDEQP